MELELFELPNLKGSPATLYVLLHSSCVLPYAIDDEYVLPTQSFLMMLVLFSACIVASIRTFTTRH